MRLSDGMIYETEYGFWIRQELGNYASCQVITWTSLFFLDKNNKIHGQSVTLKCTANRP